MMAKRENTLLDDLASMQASRLHLDKQIEQKQLQALRVLHLEVALPDTDALLKALWAIASPAVRAQLTQPDAPKDGTRQKTKRKRYDEAFRQRVRHALEERGLSNAQVREEFGVSPATLSKWMAQWGMAAIRKRNGAANGDGRAAGSSPNA